MNKDKEIKELLDRISACNGLSLICFIFGLMFISGALYCALREFFILFLLNSIGALWISAKQSCIRAYKKEYKLALEKLKPKQEN